MRRTVLALGFLLLPATFAGARIFIQIAKSFSDRVPISVFIGREDEPYWREFLETLRRDFEYSGHLRVTAARLAADPAAERRSVAAGLVLTAPPGRERFVVEDAEDGQTLFDGTVARNGNARVYAHAVADAVVLGLTGRPGIASSRIAYVSGAPGSYRIWTVDSDGANRTRVTDTDFLVHYPRWTAGNRALLAVSYDNGWPKLSTLNLSTGALKPFLTEPGLNACASVCPKVGEIAVVLSRSGNPEIYRVDAAAGRVLARVTDYRGVDGSPAFSPDGREIAFVSDRQGGPQIHVMTRDGAGVRRISYVSGYSTSPAWSPDGRSIAYVFSRGGSFGMAIHDTEMKRTVQTEDGLGCEEISWAPDSRHIVYARTDRRPASLWIYDTVSREKRRLTPEDQPCFSPCWSF